jgi:hypothetical protein
MTTYRTAAHPDELALTDDELAALVYTAWVAAHRARCNAPEGAVYGPLLTQAEEALSDALDDLAETDDKELF